VFARYLIGSFYGETPYRVSVFNSSGQLVRQWSPEGDTDPLFEIGNTIATPAFGNFDQDSDMEIAFLIAAPGYVPGRDERSSLQVYNLDGTRLSGWPRQISGTYISSNVIAADLNRDGRDEIIAQTGCGANRSADCESVFAFMGDSSILPGWPSRIQVEGRRANFSELRSLAAADVDQDGSLEVLACFEAHGCTLLDRNGKVFKNSPKWPYVLEDLRGILSHGRGGPFLLDFDGDGSLEIAIIGVEGADDVSLGEPFGYRQRWKLRVLSNLGQRRLDLEQYLNEGALPDALYGRWAFGDWNGDSFLELHFGDRPPSHLNQPGHSRRSGHYVRDLTRKIPRSRLRWNGNGGDQRKLNRAE
jgi:hypothetical protein